MGREEEVPPGEGGHPSQKAPKLRHLAGQAPGAQEFLEGAAQSSGLLEERGGW